MNIAVIVPAFNERHQIRRCLSAIDQPCTVVDGGSWDGTPRIAAAVIGRVWHGPRDLAQQCQFGVRRSRLAREADVLLFIGAASRLPPGWSDEVHRLFANPDVIFGGFSLALVHARWRHRFRAGCGNVWARVAHRALPDQGLLVRRSAFEEAGGFSPLSPSPFAELCRTLGRRGEFRLSWLATETAPRRWPTALGRSLWNSLRFRFS